MRIRYFVDKGYGVVTDGGALIIIQRPDMHPDKTPIYYNNKCDLWLAINAIGLKMMPDGSIVPETGEDIDMATEMLIKAESQYPLNRQ